MTYKGTPPQRKRKRERRRKKRFNPLKIVLVLAVAFLIYHFNIDAFYQLILNNTEVDASTEAFSSIDDPYKDVPLHNYNWDRLTQTSDRIEYTEANGYEAVQGVDVSRYQGDIDWTKVKDSGMSFAMIRLGYRGYDSGKIDIDEKFNQNILKATSADLKVGVYFFSQAITEDEAVEEAEFVLQNLSGYDISFPIVFDLEDISATDHRTYNLTKEERTKIATAFCDCIESAGYTPMIYGNASWLTTCYDLTKIIKYNLWLAQYSDCPSFKYDFQMWQYTNKGYVNGINHTVDINLCFVPF